MLPRLRFVFAAAFIAAFPWILIGSGILASAQNTPISENARPGAAVSVAAGDLRDAHHKHVLSFVRRSRELERLRELGSAPLSEWIATPAGLSLPEASPEPDEPHGQPVMMEPAAEPAAQDTPPEAIPQTASLPVEPAPDLGADAAVPAAAQEQPPNTAADLTSERSDPAPEAANDSVVPDVSHVDWSKIVPPLPRARGEANRTPEARRLRKKRVLFAPHGRQAHAEPFITTASSPNPFVGPPAGPTTVNPGRSNSVPH